MTIENATPSTGMDQAAMLSVLSGLYDKLVNDVAQRVLAQLNTTTLESAMDSWAMTSGILEDRVNDLLVTALDNHDFDDAVRGSLENIDLDDMITTAVQELDFEVRVSR